MKHILQTPSFGLSIVGYAALLATIVKTPGTKIMDVLAFLCLGLVGAATITTMQDEVKSQGLTWNWGGLIKAMRHPSKDFLLRFAVHVPQFLTAVVIALRWRSRSKRRVSND